MDKHADNNVVTGRFGKVHTNALQGVGMVPQTHDIATAVVATAVVVAEACNTMDTDPDLVQFFRKNHRLAFGTALGTLSEHLDNVIDMESEFLQHGDVASMSDALHELRTHMDYVFICARHMGCDSPPTEDDALHFPELAAMKAATAQNILPESTSATKSPTMLRVTLKDLNPDPAYDA